MPLNYLNNFWILFKMPLINCKIELKLKYCVLAANTNFNKIIYLLSKTQNHMYLQLHY